MVKINKNIPIPPLGKYRVPVKSLLTNQYIILHFTRHLIKKIYSLSFSQVGIKYALIESNPIKIDMILIIKFVDLGSSGFLGLM